MPPPAALGKKQSETADCSKRNWNTRRPQERIRALTESARICAGLWLPIQFGIHAGTFGSSRLSCSCRFRFNQLTEDPWKH